MKKYVGSIDQGTTSTRFIIFDHGGNIISTGQKEHEQIFPKPGWVEHDPEEVMFNTKEVIEIALERAGITGDDLAAVGVTNQRETTVVWDKITGRPLHNAIVWQDTRTDKLCKELGGDQGDDRFREKTGLPLATYFSGPKIKWLIENVPEVDKAVKEGRALFGNMDTWVIWNLSGGQYKGAHVTDVTNASRTMLMNLETLKWDDEILEIFELPKSILPKICASSEVYANTVKDGPFKSEVPIAGDLGDQQAAMVGQTCFEVGEAKNTYGTGCFMLINTGYEIVPSQHGLLTTPCYKFGDDKTVYALEGSIAIAGALVQWLRDNLGLIENSPEVETLAGTVEDNGGIYFVPAFSGLFAPYWKSNARGVIAGLTRFINKGHIARAALEATAYQTREVLEAMYNDLLMQFQSDLLGVPVIRPRVAETTALGAAYAAGLAVGFWKNTKELKKNWSVDRIWEPEMDPDASQACYQQWLKAVKRTFDWVE